MNEKIAEIAKKAGITFKPMMIDGEEYSYQHVHFNDYTKGVEDEAGCIKLFAELIVRECVQTLIDKTPERYTNESAEEYWGEYCEEDWDKGYDRAMQDCVNHIQEHFGIKE